MESLIRDREIKKLRKKGKKLSEIAKKFKLTPERVRQICSEENKDKVYDQIEKKYKDILNLNDKQKYDFNWVTREVERLTPQDRSKGVVIQRRQLVQYLHDKLGLSFLKIATLLQRDHTSITNLYHGTK